MHCVIEKAGELFYQHAVPFFEEIHHFRAHAQEDAHHASLGFSLIKSEELCEEDLTIFKQGWEMMISLTDRIAERTMHSHA